MFRTLTAKGIEDLTRELAKLDDSPLECDGMTNIISRLLDRLYVKYSVFRGFAIDHKNNKRTPLHYWIQLDTGHVVDFRARMWLGKDEHVPHGVFSPTDFPALEYRPEEQIIAANLNDAICNLLSDNRYNSIDVTSIDFVREYELELVDSKNCVYVHCNDGSTVGRFSSRGIDIHNSVTDQMNGKPECLLCTHDFASQSDWETFRTKAKELWKIEIPQDAFDQALLKP